MGWDFVTTLANVHLDDTLGVDRETLVRVDSHAEETGVGVDKLVGITGFQVPKHRGIIKVGQVGHVLAFLVFGGVHLTALIFLKGFLAIGNLDDDQVTFGADNLTELVT